MAAASKRCRSRDFEEHNVALIETETGHNYKFKKREGENSVDIKLYLSKLHDIVSRKGNVLREV